MSKEDVPYAYLERPSWTVRRRVVIAALLYIAGNLEFIIIKGTDTALNSQIGLGLLGAGVSIIAAYVFGSNMDQANFNNALANVQGIRPPPSSPAGAMVAVPIVKPATIVNTDSATAVKNNPVPPKKEEDD